MSASKPLWQLMRDAYLDAIRQRGASPEGFAGELRAIAEEVPKATGLLSLSPRSTDVIVKWLLSEAKRAERGENPQEPTFTPEEVELIQAPWSCLTPPAVDPQEQTPEDDEPLPLLCSPTDCTAVPPSLPRFNPNATVEPDKGLLTSYIQARIEDVIAELNRLTALVAESREPTRKGASKPLWRLMLDAVIDAIPTGSLGHRGFAAELRVIAEEIHQRVELWHADDVIRWLRAEANRAERGEEE